MNVLITDYCNKISPMFMPILRISVSYIIMGWCFRHTKIDWLKYLCKGSKNANLC